MGDPRSRLLVLRALTVTALSLTLGAGTALAQDGGAKAAPESNARAGELPGPGPVQPDPKPDPKPDAVSQTREGELRLKLHGLRGGRATVGKRFRANGYLYPYVPGEKVTLKIKRGNRTIRRKTVKPKPAAKGSEYGRIKIADKQVRPGRYSVQAIHEGSERVSYARTRTKRFKIRYPKLRKGNKSKTVKLLNKLLARKGYVNDKGKRFNDATGRAVLAFRKVNKMARNPKATPAIFKKLAKGKGGYRLRRPGSGKHVEVDISRQVMVLAKGRKVKEIYHVSTGAPATPTIPGSWRFYRKEPGLNSLGMYYSVYYNRGYATHGYKSVPTYPASHGCTRNPPPDARHIYNWIDIGDKIHVYR